MTRANIDRLLAIATPEQPALSPDGSRVVYSLRTLNDAADRDERALWQVATDGGEPQQLTRGTADTSAAFSPDGSAIAFLRAIDGPSQVYVLPIAGGEARQLTSLPLGAGTPVWSPDGTRIAFAAPVDKAAAPTDGLDAISQRRTGPLVATRLLYKADGSGHLGTLRNRLHVVDVATGKVTVVTDGDWHATDPVWSPDSTELAYSSSVADDADLTMAMPALITSATDPLAPSRVVGPAQSNVVITGWSADGETLTAIGRTDLDVGNSSLLLINAHDGSVTDLTSPLDRNVMPGGPGYPGGLAQHDEANDIIACIRDNGWTHLYRVTRKGATTPLIAGENAVSGLSVAGHTAAVILGTTTTVAEVAIVDLRTGALTVRTHHSDVDAPIVSAVERQFQISDGTVVTGWLRRNPELSGPLPLLLDIHGGPHNAWNGAADVAHAYHHELVSRGWAVLTLNPRGSDGYGEAFMRGVIGAWGISDRNDFLEPLDELVAEGTADASRLAVTGYSYGGYMTCYLTSRDDRFAAAVPGGIVADLTSQAGTSDAGHFLSAIENGVTPWQDPERLAPQSPYTRVADVKTPTLILHGAADERCPAGQAEQWFTALRERDVPVEMVLYPGASHLFILNGTPSHRRDWNQRIVDWVEQYAPPTGRPARRRIDAAHWQQRLTALASAHQVVGATLGIAQLDGDEVVASFGTTNVRTDVPVTADTLFQIGSISKVWTTTVVMQLVDEGLLDLDAPLINVIPELRLSDPDVQAGVTMRHLLTHSSGIDGDVFTDTGRGDDSLEKYVGLMSDIGQNHPIGVTFSYCNSGFSLAGRVIEKLTGKVWDQAMRERLFSPLGLTHTVTLPEEAIMYRAASGHAEVTAEGPQLAPVWTLPRSAGPAGLISAQAHDVLEFARMHLRGGVAADGTRVLSDATTARMQQHEIDLPDTNVLGDSWGLGWIRFEWDGKRLIGHDGNTIGQSAFLRILPEAGLAVTLLTNGGNSHDLYVDLYSEIFAELAGITMPRDYAPPAEPFVTDATPYLGTYIRAGVTAEIFERDSDVVMRTTITGPLAALTPEPVEEHVLTPVKEGEFALRAEGSQSWNSVVFYTLPTGEPYMHFGVRAAPKVGS